MATTKYLGPPLQVGNAIPFSDRWPSIVHRLNAKIMEIVKFRLKLMFSPRCNTLAGCHNRSKRLPDRQLPRPVALNRLPQPVTPTSYPNQLPQPTVAPTGCPRRLPQPVTPTGCPNRRLPPPVAPTGYLNRLPQPVTPTGYPNRLP